MQSGTGEAIIIMKAGDDVEAMKAGRWGNYGKIVSVHDDGTYDVHIPDEGITLTHKPVEEIRPVTTTPEQRMKEDVEQALTALTAPKFSEGRAIRLGQSRTCCLSLALCAVFLATGAASKFFEAYSLMPQPGKHPSGFCELCHYQRYLGRQCHLWPETSARCHEDFIPMIYVGAFLLTLALFSMILIGISLRDSCGAIRGAHTLGESDRFTFYGTVYPLCERLGFNRVFWCCGGSEDTESEVAEYDEAEEDLRRARRKVKMAAITSRFGML